MGILGELVTRIQERDGSSRMRRGKVCSEPQGALLPCVLEGWLFHASTRLTTPDLGTTLACIISVDGVWNDRTRGKALTPERTATSRKDGVSHHAADAGMTTKRGCSAVVDWQHYVRTLETTVKTS